MRILSIATTHPRWPGDSEPAFVHDLNRTLVQRGHQVSCLLPHAPGAARREDMDGVQLRRFRYAWPERAEQLCYEGGALPNLRARPMARLVLPGFLAAQAAALFRELRTGHYDLVHCHWLVPQGLTLAALDRAPRLPWVATAHAGDVFTRHPLFEAANRAVLHRCDLCTVNSSLTLARVQELDPDAPTQVIPMGVDLSDFSSERASVDRRRALGGGDPLILFAGRFAEKKGILYLLRALPRIRAALPGARLAIVGFGPDEKRIHAEIDRLQLQPFVRMPGRVSHAAMAESLASADLFVAPSVIDSRGDTEGLGVVLLEALASGTPVVASEIGGIPDIVQHERTGLLSRPEDPDDIARQCIRMLTEPDLARATVAAGREHVAARFSWQGVASQFEEAFEALVSGSSLTG